MAQFKFISVEDARKKLLDSQTILVDIRDVESYLNSRLKSAVHLSEKNLSDFVKGTPKKTPVMVMCYHGKSSQGVAHYLTIQGFENVYSIEGGYEAWEKEISREF